MHTAKSDKLAPGPPAVAPLLDLLRDPDEEVRQFAGVMLGSLKDPAAVAPLVAALGERTNILDYMRFAMVPLWFVSLWCVWKIGAALFSRLAGLWAVVLISLLPWWFFCALEYRTDNLWTPLWLGVFRKSSSIRLRRTRRLKSSAGFAIVTRRTIACRSRTKHSVRPNSRAGALATLESVPVPTIVGADPDLRGLINFGFFGVIARPLFIWLRWIEGIVRNWGWAICIQTLIINLALMPLRISSMKSALKMQKIQPQMNSIKEKYKKYGILVDGILGGTAFLLREAVKLAKPRNLGFCFQVESASESV